MKAIIIGAGLYGCVLANRLADAGYDVDIYDKRLTIGGNCYDYDIYGIKVHRYGPHIFHTNNFEIWSFINSFGPFNRFINSPMVVGADNKLYNMPFNMNTFIHLFGVKTPREVQEIIDAETKGLKRDTYHNLKEMAIATLGKTVYRLLIEQYTKKQWGKDPENLPASIINRLPFRLNFDNNYFDDEYQGIPVNGYTEIFSMMLLSGKIHIHLGMTLEPDQIFGTDEIPIFYTGSIDELFKYQFGELEYRSLDFQTEIYTNQNNYQGVAVINNSSDEKYTRTIEWRWFNEKEHYRSDRTVVTREFPCDWKRGKTRFYPVNTDRNQEKYHKYLSLLKDHSNIHVGGRLGLYEYLNMDECVLKALEQANDFISGY